MKSPRRACRSGSSTPPSATAAGRSFTDFDGWSVPAPGWRALYRREDDFLAVTGPGSCEGWYEGNLGADEEWVTAAGAQQSLVLLAAPVQHPSLYGYAVEAGAAFALLVPLMVV
ncbi:hypothetical protein [Streptomyces sp. Mg1]|uniref:hypothetical protein n=1 Tax=Streptomyces sp. Mg1 TaxID=465541 RepID=UPI00030E84AA|nr:hypothetical protein [Streptomyces sp. Mg1]